MLSYKKSEMLPFVKEQRLAVKNKVSVSYYNLTLFKKKRLLDKMLQEKENNI